MPVIDDGQPNSLLTDQRRVLIKFDIKFYHILRPFAYLAVSNFRPCKSNIVSAKDFHQLSDRCFCDVLGASFINERPEGNYLRSSSDRSGSMCAHTPCKSRLWHRALCNTRHVFLVCRPGMSLSHFAYFDLCRVCGHGDNTIDGPSKMVLGSFGEPEFLSDAFGFGFSESSVRG